MRHSFFRIQKLPVFATFFVMANLFYASFSAARADQYTAVPTGDALYRNLSVVERNGWLNSASRTPNVEVKSLTRYELALQTAGAIFLVSARVEADANWAQSVSPSAFEALRLLTTNLRPELQKLGVDVAATLQLLKRVTTATSSTRSAASTAPDATRDVTRDATRATRALPLPRRFNNASNFANGHVSIGLGRGFALRADVRADAETPNLGSLALRESQLPRGVGTAVGGGLDWTPRDGVTLSTGVENIRGGTQSVGTRFSSDVGVSAFNNRVSLVANLSRLKMENVEDASTFAGVNFGVGVSENVRLNLLYQRLFSTPSPSRSDQVVAGGVSIKF